jgi:protein-S-isoprenylcysteine O-methyltransferase Ste14
MDIDIFKASLFSLIVMLVAWAWILKYGTLRKARRYSERREPVAKDEGFKLVGKLIFVFMNAVTIASFWTSSGALLLLWRDDRVRVSGMLLVIFATFLYVLSLRYLGDNYSPFFDSYQPLRIVTNGPYKYVRHPVYLANILFAAGLFLSSGSLWIVVFGGYGGFKIICAMLKEEASLANTLPGYKAYQKRTASLIPFIY